MTEENEIVVKVDKGADGYYAKKLDISNIADDDALWDFVDENGAWLLSPDWKEGYVVEHKYDGGESWQFFPDWEMVEEAYEEKLVNALKTDGFLVDCSDDAEEDDYVVSLHTVRI